MLYLAIESSCDETAVAVVSSPSGVDEFEIRSNVIASQIDIHAKFGGVVPEIAGRAHIEAISSLAYRALADAGVSAKDIDCVAVTSEPGLIGALLVGVNFAKGFAYANKKPLVAVNHIKGHVAANYIEGGIKAPFIAFVASGGHTSIIRASSFTDFETVGRTLDDAIGEAFDKTGRKMGLTYPCGAAMDKLAAKGDPEAYKMPPAHIRDGSYNFSLSGLKTFTINLMNTAEMKGEEINFNDLCASLTKSICDSVAHQLLRCLRDSNINTLLAAGGVLANTHLRRTLVRMCDKNGIELHMPPPYLCGDNGVMIAAAAKYEFEAGRYADMSLDGAPSSKDDWKRC
ncbi:MAG: tRNA (adenosine(37)-N6)-threonylcarbamoyltransferase complex transferase subunit TsaD [Clostridia bacterium]|nr:tRNA (adenosine(37)-N6)-threonylcarbamoyltransferase complex transferase subunit TsaD [Clostridia bacterium]MBQ3869435.1 tRNA (adenosine(37)-N6)-threonylcarbamoyltransferase complex transferase subunit TsaD [Clostridia bacterium]